MSLVLKAAAMFAAVIVSVPAVDQSPTMAPVDLVARSKAPTEAGEVVDIVQSINKYVNEHIEGEDDYAHYGMVDLWVQYPADNKGDCEDYAVTKMGFLQRHGVPVVSETKLVGVIVPIPGKRGKFDGHEILALRLPKGTVVYLDNLNPEIMTRAELEAKGYQFFDWKA